MSKDIHLTKKKEIHIFSHIFFIIVSAIMILPLLLVLSVSFSDEMDIAKYGYRLIPKNFSIEAYSYLFKNPDAIINGYIVTIFISVVTMVLSVLLMSMIAYALSRDIMMFKSGISFYLYFTMLFGGGMVPTYILMTQYLRLTDNILVYILPALVNPWYVFMMRTYMRDLPGALVESAYIDGANEYTIYFRIILPLSLPALATIGLFVFLNQWNSWYPSLLYINNPKLHTLQYQLQRIMQNIQLLQQESMGFEGMLSRKDIPSETVRMAMVIVVAGPALVIFPFFQKYFVEGLTVGSVKG